jgi:hypothetical protein
VSGVVGVMDARLVRGTGGVVVKLGDEGVTQGLAV